MSNRKDCWGEVHSTLTFLDVANGKITNQYFSLVLFQLSDKAFRKLFSPLRVFCKSTLRALKRMYYLLTFCKNWCFQVYSTINLNCNFQIFAKKIMLIISMNLLILFNTLSQNTYPSFQYVPCKENFRNCIEIYIVSFIQRHVD